MKTLGLVLLIPIGLLATVCLCTVIYFIADDLVVNIKNKHYKRFWITVAAYLFLAATVIGIILVR